MGKFKKAAVRNKPHSHLHIIFCEVLYVEQEVHHIAVLHHIILALGADKALGPGSGQRTAFFEIVIGDHLCTDKATLKVGMNFACGLGGPSCPF